MSKSSRRQEPERLDAHRTARGKRASGAAPEPSGGSNEPPTSFEEAPQVKRARHLDELREIVDAGEYRPDPAKIAESMLENERS